MYVVGTELLITGNSGAIFEATAITPEWLKFEITSRQEEVPLAEEILARVDLTLYRVRYGAYDEILCYWVDVRAQGGVGFVYRVGNSWLIDTFLPGRYPYSKYGLGTWCSERVIVALKHGENK